MIFLYDDFVELRGFPDYYINENGDILSRKRGKPHILTHKILKRGHHFVALRGKNGLSYKLVHRLVAITFIPNPDNLPIVRHLDDNKDNNNVSNLAWGTIKDNVADANKNKCYRGGTISTCRYKKIIAMKGSEELHFDAIKTCAEKLNVDRSNISKVLKHKLNHTGGWKFEYDIKEAEMYTNEDLKEMLWVELSNMKQDKKIRRFEVTYNNVEKNFNIWIEWPDLHCCVLDVLTVEDLKTELAKSLPVKKSWKCHICRYYLKNCDGCKKGFYNSMFVPCPDWKGPEYQPTDNDLCEALDVLIAESKQMTSRMPYIHKGADWLMTYILDLVGYDLSLYNKVPKGYEEDPDNYCDTFAPIIFWQCILCRRYDNRNLCCLDGLNEGWVHENHCPSFIHVEEPINQKFFKYMMEMIYNEKADAELNWEAIHYNMDRFMSYVIESLGYFKFAKKYRELELEYLEVPF